MTTLGGDAAPVSESPGYAMQPAPRDDEHDPMNLFQEINERRARVENTELLRNLRSL
jgi:hypothetical protein